MASAQTWRIKKRWVSKFGGFLGTSRAGHLAIELGLLGTFVLLSLKTCTLYHEKLFKFSKQPGS